MSATVYHDFLESRDTVVVIGKKIHHTKNRDRKQTNKKKISVKTTFNRFPVTQYLDVRFFVGVEKHSKAYSYI